MYPSKIFAETYSFKKAISVSVESISKKNQWKSRCSWICRY